MKPSIKTIVTGLLMVLLPLIYDAHILAQPLYGHRPLIVNGAKYEVVFDFDTKINDGYAKGVEKNGILIVPKKYYHVEGFLRQGKVYIFAYATKSDFNPYSDYRRADVSDGDGNIIFPSSKGISSMCDGIIGDNGISIPLFHSSSTGAVYDENGKLLFYKKYDLFSGEIKEMNGIVYLTPANKSENYGIYEFKNNSVEEILPQEFKGVKVLDNDLFAFEMNGYWGVMRRNRSIVIPTSRQYSDISYNQTFKIFTFSKTIDNVVYKGECNANGVQTVIQKDHTISNPSSTKTGQQSATTTTPKQEKKTEPTQQAAPQPQPRQPQPMQVWVQCLGCYGSGQCQGCGGLGWRYISSSSPHSQCIICGGSGKCNQCAGHGGHNEIQYR